MKAWFWHLWGFKYLEIQIGRFEGANVFSCSFDIKKYRDHPGFCLFIEFFYRHLIVTFYDSRHLDEICRQKDQAVFKAEPRRS
jgi:hypothetical protein